MALSTLPSRLFDPSLLSAHAASRVAPIVGPVVFVFCQDPLVKKEVIDAFLETLKTQNGIAFTDKFQYVKWPAEYTPGAMGEFAFNVPGKPPTIDHTKNVWASQVLAKPYPPPVVEKPVEKPASLLKQLTGGRLG